MSESGFPNARYANKHYGDGLLAVACCSFLFGDVTRRTVFMLVLLIVIEQYHARAHSHVTQLINNDKRAGGAILRITIEANRTIDDPVNHTNLVEL